MEQLEIVRRLERLEQANRRLRLAASAAALGLVALLIAGVAPVPGAPRPPADEVEASRFVVRGPSGDEACVIGVDPKGFPYLLMRKDKANAILTLNGPGLLLRGEDGRRSAFLGIDTRGSTKLELTSEKLIDGVRLAVKPDGAAGVYLLDQTGRDRLGLEASLEAGALLSTRDTRGAPRATFGVDPQDLPALMLIDSAGRRRAGLLIGPDEAPLLSVEDEGGRPRVEITSQFDGSPILRIRRADGGVSFQAP